MAFQTFDPYNYISIERNGSLIRLPHRFCELNQITSDMRVRSLSWGPAEDMFISIVFGEATGESPRVRRGSRFGTDTLHIADRRSGGRYHSLVLHCAHVLGKVAREYHINRSDLVGKYSYTKRTGKVGDQYVIYLNPLLWHLPFRVLRLVEQFDGEPFLFPSFTTRLV